MTPALFTRACPAWSRLKDFVDHETYLPLRWDLADLEEVVRRALEEPRRARRIAENGRRRLRDYFERGGFVADVARVADALAGRRRALAA